MAIIILQGADFSANNLGQIDVFMDFHDTTLSVFEKFGITADRTNPMHVATDKFVRSLIVAGIWGNGKIDNLCLPYLAILANNSNPSITTAVQNCIGDGNFMVPNSGENINLEFNSNGIRPIRNDGSAMKLIAPANFDTDNMHYSAYVLNDADLEWEYAQNGTTRGYKNIFGAGWGILSFINGSPDNLIKFHVSNSPDNIAIGDGNLRNKARFMIGTIKTSENEGKGVYYENGIKYLTNGTSRYSITTEPIFGIYGNSSYPSNPASYNNPFKFTMLAPCGILSTGGYLNETEATAFNSAAQNLVTAIHTYMD